MTFKTLIRGTILPANKNDKYLIYLLKKRQNIEHFTVKKITQNKQELILLGRPLCDL